MKNKTTAIVASTLLTALFSSQAVIAGDNEHDEYAFTSVFESSQESSGYKERVNYSIEQSEDLDAELFPSPEGS